jgi:hypothetical protein
MVARSYAQDMRAATSTPDMYDMANLQTDTIEFSAGGQVQTIDLPFCSELNQVQSAWDSFTNAYSHGMYYIYLVQTLGFMDCPQICVILNSGLLKLNR